MLFFQSWPSTDLFCKTNKNSRHKSKYLLVLVSAFYSIDVYNSFVFLCELELFQSKCKL